MISDRCHSGRRQRGDCSARGTRSHTHTHTHRYTGGGGPSRTHPRGHKNRRVNIIDVQSDGGVSRRRRCEGGDAPLGAEGVGPNIGAEICRLLPFIMKIEAVITPPFCRAYSRRTPSHAGPCACPASPGRTPALRAWRLRGVGLDRPGIYHTAINVIGGAPAPHCKGPCPRRQQGRQVQCARRVAHRHGPHTLAARHAPPRLAACWGGGGARRCVAAASDSPPRRTPLRPHLQDAIYIRGVSE